MTTAGTQKTGSGLFSKLIVAALLALAIGLYLQIVMKDGERYAEEQPAPQASVRIVEDNTQTDSAQQSLKALPEEQQAVIMRVFAPELLNSDVVAND